MILFRAPPSILYTGIPYFFPYRSHRAMSAAALALEFFTMQSWTDRVMSSKSSTSRPTRVLLIWSWKAPMMAPVVSPVMTPVGGASPNPTSPLSVWISTMMSSTLLTCRRAVLNGTRRGTEIRPRRTFVIFISIPSLISQPASFIQSQAGFHRPLTVDSLFYFASRYRASA